jgi:hypothetical protein
LKELLSTAGSGLINTGSGFYTLDSDFFGPGCLFSNWVSGF